MKRTTMFLAVTCATLGFLHAGAYGHTKNYKVASSFVFANSGFNGTVSSPESDCIRNRQVRLYDVHTPSNPSFAGGGTSDRSGAWETGTGFFDPAGTYELVIDAKTLKKNRKHSHKCKAYSKTTQFQPPPAP